MSTFRPNIAFFVQKGDIDTVATLLEEHGSERLEGGVGKWALFAAIRAESIPLAQVLLDHGVDINCTDSMNHTPLFCSIHTENVDMVRFLLSRDADPNVDTAWPALLKAVSQDHCDDELVSMLLDAGADVHAVAHDGRTTALHLAAQNRSLADVTTLLEAGADANVINMRRGIESGVLHEVMHAREQETTES